jgi:hypothetical protein
MSKLEEKELQELKQSLAKPQQIAQEIGLIQLNNQRLPELYEAYKNAIKEQQDKIKAVEDKHGKGSLDINTGEITPIEE